MEDFEYLWTTEKDTHCLVRSDERYGIFNLTNYFFKIIEDNELAFKVIDTMLEHGVRTFTSEEFKEYRKANPVPFPDTDPIFGIPPEGYRNKFYY